MEGLNSLLNNVSQPTTQVKKTDTLSGGSDEGGDFLSFVLDSVNKNKNISEKDAKEIIQKASQKTSDTNSTKLDVGDTGTLLENADFIQLLGLLESLNGGEKLGSFPTLSNNLAKLLSTEKNVNEIKGAKNLQDLINLSKKFDLNLSNIKITKEDVATLKEQFKGLAQNGFFDFKEVVLDQVTKKKVQNVLEQTTKKDETINLNKLLQSVTPKETVLKDEKSLNLKQTNKQSDVTLAKIEGDKTLSKAVSNNDIKNEVKIQTTKHKTDPSIDEYLANLTKRAIKEQVNETQNSKFDNKNSISLQDLLKDTSLETSANESNSGESNTNSNQNSLVKDIVANAKMQAKNTQIKQTFETFASDLQEKINEYKPPVTRFHMTLNPGNLGEVEVTMINRGNNLHINFNSNNQTMQLFIQNQAEFKNSLVNMGFTELSMNFSDQRQSGNQNDRGKFKNYEQNFDEQDSDEQKVVLELVLPRYI
ncbi:flagellar hook-length control protein FliK [Campylobacter hyointestinalis]|uniref:flagellar hook-length control protein FliK n=1 Tax=Campylobacter hyointestinalis TaxID=198 RepID=UPI0011AC0E23|nr:flagellar hook-length control protein FliK [Campylobacter hyointestinalis]MBT0612590.1 flagellar hook-length control protein FliK [Campylobacter hyointestinalis subsp. hyointestinalis]MDY2998634.1 flagellar hook-length control protein FliK [Campylobacter hyointestinalis]TWO30569.1 flagellar hook-length control protein FliK [Campylobacter hyointestinalis]